MSFLLLLSLPSELFQGSWFPHPVSRQDKQLRVEDRNRQESSTQNQVDLRNNWSSAIYNSSLLEFVLLSHDILEIFVAMDALLLKKRTVSRQNKLVAYHCGQIGAFSLHEASNLSSEMTPNWSLRLLPQ